MTPAIRHPVTRQSKTSTARSTATTRKINRARGYGAQALAPEYRRNTEKGSPTWDVTMQREDGSTFITCDVRKDAQGAMANLNVLYSRSSGRDARARAVSAVPCIHAE